MSFTWFRKHEKTFLWITVGFTIVIFALFSSMSDVDRALSDGPKAESIAGTFKVATTGDTREVEQEELLSTRRSRSRFQKMMTGSSDEVSEDDIWAFLINVADAKGAGLMISDEEVGAAVTQFTGGDLRLYEQIILGSGFPTLHRFEEFFRDYLLEQRWIQAKVRTANVLPAEDVYQRWRVDNELFDLDVVSFEDRDALTIASPGDAALREWYDELPEFRRNSLFVDPAQHDIAFASLAFDTDPDELLATLDEKIAAAIAQPTDTEIQQRFLRVKSQRYADMDAADEEALAVLRRELMILSLAARAHSQYRVQEEEARTLESFQEVMAAHGLTFTDPEGLMGPDELEVLEPIGDDILPLRLKQMRKVGDTQTITSVTGKETAAAVVYLQEVVDQRPLTYDEAREGDTDMVLAEWRKAQVDQAARDFREALREAAAALPAVKAIVDPLETAADAAAEAAIADAVAAADAGPGAPAVDDALMAQLRANEVEAVQADIDAAITGSEHLVWNAVLTKVGDVATRVDYSDVPRNYRSTLTADERDPESLEQFVKSHFSVFQLDSDGITDVLRLPAANTSFVVRVAGRSFPDMAAMFADPEGMLAARQTQSREALMLLQVEFQPAAIMAAHDLRVLEAPETEAQVRDAEVVDELEVEEPAEL